MSRIAIRVDDLGKRYRIGAIQQHTRPYVYKSLRDSIANAASAPLRAIQALTGKNATHEKRRDSQLWALRDVSFEVTRGEIVGIVGRNGAGKSTLLKLLSRITEPTTGRAEIHGRIGSLLEVGTGFHPELTGRENVYLNGAILGMKRADIVRQFDAIVEFAEVEKFIDTPVKHFSSGMYLRLAFAVAAHLETEALFVDEVLAVGDHRFQEKCLGKIKDVATTGRTVLFVSHSMASVERLCSRALAFSDGRLVADSTPQAVIAEYIGGNIGASYSEPPSELLPTISKAALRLESDSLILSVEFVSPFVFTPVFGFVMYNSLGAPVFGTNSIANPLPSTPEPSSSGRFEIAIPTEYFRPDDYFFSIWLDDHYMSYCERQSILKIDLHGSVGGGLPASFNGNAYVPTEWRYESL